jgi:acyl-CoA thioesterase-2
MTEGPLARLLKLLQLEPLDRDLFLARTPAGEGRLFGGLVAGQAVRAAQATVEADDVGLHSLHAYFLRPGQHGLPIRMVVDRIRDGRTFATRRVVAHQGGEAIFNLSCSFSRPEVGISHQDEAPEAPPPEDLPDWEQHRAEILGRPDLVRRQPVDVRTCDPDDAQGAKQPPFKRVWMRPAGTMPDDPELHTALLVYASDRTLLSTASRPHGLPWGKRMVASLDHAVWIHRVPVRFDDWILYVSASPAAHAARGLVQGAMYDRLGVRIASVSQEGLIRVPRERG